MTLTVTAGVATGYTGTVIALDVASGDEVQVQFTAGMIVNLANGTEIAFVLDSGDQGDYVVTDGYLYERDGGVPL